MPGTPFATAKWASATMNKASRRNAGPFVAGAAASVMQCSLWQPRALGSNPARATELCPTGERRAAHSPGRAVYIAHTTARGRLLAAAPAARRISRTGQRCQRLAAIHSCELRGPPAAPGEGKGAGASSSRHHPTEGPETGEGKQEASKNRTALLQNNM